MKKLIGSLLPRTTESARSGFLRGSNAFARIPLALLATFLCASTGLAATFTATTSGLWNNTSTWNNAGTPVAGDTANIPIGITVTVQSNRTEACATLVINSGSADGSANLTFSNSTSTLNVSGNATMNKPTLSGIGTASAITMNGGALTVGGNLTLDSEKDTGKTYTSEVLFTGGGTVTVTNTVSLLATSSSQGTTSLIDMTGGGTLRVIAAAPFTFTAGTFTAGAGTVEYAGSVAQTVLSSITYNNLTLSGSSAKTMTGVTVNATLSMQGTATASVAPTWGTSSTLEYKGSALQTTGPELTTVTNLTINNASGVSLNSAATVNGTLTLTAGALSIGANTLTLNGLISTTSGSLTGGASANISFGGTAASTALPAVTLNNLTINSASGISLGGDVTVGGTLTLTSGTFSVGANTLALNGPAIAGTPANLSTTSSSSLSFGGSSAGINIPSSVAALSTLTINNANGVTLNSSPTISSTL